MEAGEQIEIVIEEDDVGQRVDAVLAERLAGEVSRQVIQQWMKNGDVVLLENPERQLTKPSAKIQAGWKINITIPEPPPSDLAAYHRPIEYLHIDDDLAVLVKPAGLPVHPGPGHPDKTLVNVLVDKFGLDKLPSIGRPVRPGIVSRLDLPTHGVMVVALSDRAHLALVDMYQNRQVNKFYRAICAGRPSQEAEEIVSGIGRHPTKRFRMSIDPNGREAVTRYKLIRTWRHKDYKFSYIKTQILTGRTHQIRVHMHHLGCPVIGDQLYSRTFKRYRRFGMLLSSFRINFKHPFSDQVLDFSIPPPQSFLDFAKGYGVPDLFDGESE